MEPEKKAVVDLITGYGLEHRCDRVEARQVSDRELRFPYAQPLSSAAVLFIDHREYRIAAQQQSGSSLDVQIDPVE